MWKQEEKPILLGDKFCTISFRHFFPRKKRKKRAKLHERDWPGIVCFLFLLLLLPINCRSIHCLSKGRQQLWAIIITIDDDGDKISSKIFIFFSFLFLIYWFNIYRL